MVEIPWQSIVFIILSLICFTKLSRLLQFAIIVLPLTTIALVNVYLTPTFSINLSQYGIILLFMFILLQKMTRKANYAPMPRELIASMLTFILFIPISWAATNNPNNYTLIYNPLSGYTKLPLIFSIQNISKGMYTAFGFLIFIVSYKAVSAGNYRAIARTFVFSGFLMALFGLLDFVLPFQMEELRRILLPANASMGAFGYGPVIALKGIHRVYGLMWEAGGLAEYLLGVIFVILPNLILNTAIFSKLKDKLLLLTIGVITILTGSTSIVVAILLFPVMLFLMPFLSSKKKILRMWSKGIGIVLLLALVIWGLSFIFPDNIKYFYEWTSYKLRLASEVGGGARMAGSLVLLKEIFPQSPIIGLGLGSVGTECSTYGAGIVMLLVNVGIVGTLLYLSVVFFTIKRALKMLRYDNSENYPFRLGFLWAFIFVVTVEFLGRGLGILSAPHLWFLAGVCIGIAKQSQGIVHKGKS